MKHTRRTLALVAACTIAALSFPAAAVASEAPSLSAHQQFLVHALDAETLTAPEQIELVDAYAAAANELTLDDIDIFAGESGYVEATLPNGTVISLGAEPVTASGATARAGLTGQYRIWGNNGYSSHEFYLQFAQVSGNTNYTRIVGNGSGHTVAAWASASYDASSKYISVIKRVEDVAGAARAQGGVNMVLPLGVAQHNVGVDAWVYRGSLSTALFG